MTFRIIILTVLLLTLSCKEKTTADFIFPDIKDIDEITTVLLFHDTLPIFKRPNIPDTTICPDGRKVIHYPLVVPICLGLRKIKVLPPDTSTIPGPPSLEKIRFESLLNIDIDGKKIFESKDSLFLFAQNDTLFNIQLPSKFLDTLQLTSVDEQKRKNEKQKFSADFYDISLPIFSADLKTAYVEVRHLCSMCGGASAYILQKVNGHWQVKKSFGLWIS